MSKIKFKDAIKSNKPVLVDFYATWCGPCKALSPVINEVKRELGTSMRVIKVDVDQKKALSNKYKVKSLPTLAIFKNGEILWRSTGMKTKRELMNIANQFIDNPAPSNGEVSQTKSKVSTTPVKKKSWFAKLFGK